MIRNTFLFLISSIYAFSVGAQLSDNKIDNDYHSGLSIDTSRYQDLPLFEPWEGIEIDIPSAISLEAFVPRVRSQEANDNVGGWAVGYYFASTEWAMITNQSNKAMLTAFAYDPLYLNAVGGEGDACGGEVYLPDLCQSLVEDGAKRLNIDQATCDNQVVFNEEQSLLDFEETVRLTDVNRADSSNLLSVKYALATYHAVVFSMHTPESFQFIAKDGLFRPSSEERNRTTMTTPHALTIVGFDDDLYGGAFRVVNSWGTEWADEGYCWITYEDFIAFQEAAYKISTSLKIPDLVDYGAAEDGFGRQHIKKYGFFEGFLDAKGRPEKGIYMNEKLKKGRGGSRYMKRLVKKQGGFLVYAEGNFKIPIAAVIY